MAYVITHPEVVIDPNVPVPRWPLSERGRERTRSMLGQPWMGDIRRVCCSSEQKALDTAEIVAEHLGLEREVLEALGENDRSSTGYLAADEFARMREAFFGRPKESVRGWERAVDAQRRIIDTVEALLREGEADGAVAIVSHGGVSTLLRCHLAGAPISPDADQPGAGGGNYYAFDIASRALLSDWRPIDEIS